MLARELSRGVEEGIALPPAFPDHVVGNHPEQLEGLHIPSLLRNNLGLLWVRCGCQAEPMAVRQSSWDH